MMRFAGGPVAGLSATLLMEYVSQALYDRQSVPSREREEELRAEMPTTTLVRKVARLTGAQLNDATAERLGTVTGPTVTHARAVAAHIAYGAALGLMLAAGARR